MGKNTDNHYKEDKHLLVKPDAKVNLDDYDTGYTGEFKNKSDAEEKLRADVESLTGLQDKLYSSQKYGLLIVFQAMDAAGKDSTIKHVMSGVNPQGCDVYSFKQPNPVELAHDFLWRVHRNVPPKGKIGIFNRSHYEEVLVSRVHPELVLKQNLPGIDSIDKIDNEFWERRYKRISNFEKLLSDTGTKIVKFFLHVSKKEQKKRFLARIDKAEKNWKFSTADLKERALWDKYSEAYEKAISNTSTEYAPWYIIPADNKWFMRAAVGDILVGILEGMNLKYPKFNEEEKAELAKAKEELLDEKD
jgi:PPK2 family polyphosphate:nucleotide phosphotransferase